MITSTNTIKALHKSQNPFIKNSLHKLGRGLLQFDKKQLLKPTACMLLNDKILNNFPL